MNSEPIETWLRRHCGLEADSLGPGMVARAVQARSAQLGLGGPSEYFELLISSQTEQQELIDRVVVAETWFFRDRPALDAIARHAVDTWGPAHPGATFRVLCVPCSTGEEPYSLAMAFAQAGWPLDRLAIEAFDISRDNIVRAREGVYRRNSFRGDDLAFRDVFLEPAGAEKWRVGRRARAPVTFTEGNLLAPDFSIGRGAYDAIFCRNLLIYFDRPTQNRAIATLGALLAPAGLFAVGPAEPVLLFEHGYSALGTPGAFLLQRTPPRLRAALPPPPPILKWSLPAPKPALPKPASVPARMSVAPEPPSDTFASIQTLADAGRLAEAAARGTALLERGPTPELLYLLGVIADATGDAARAAELYRKTLYLAPQHVDALTQLAFQAEKSGDLHAARTLRARAERAHGKTTPAA